MNLEMIFKDASKDDTAEQYVLLDDDRDFWDNFTRQRNWWRAHKAASFKPFVMRE